MEEFLTIIKDGFSELEDRRREEGQRHPFINLVVISVLALIANADGEKDIAEYGRSKQDWLAKFLTLKHGTPSCSTFERFFQAVDPEQFEKCFQEVVKLLPLEKLGDHIAIDGKTIRGSYDTGSEKSQAHIVTAFETEHGISLAQIKTEEKSNEITAIPELLDFLSIKGSTITIDAMGCQKSITEKIRAKKGNWVLALKENHPNFYKEVTEFFDEAKTKNFEDLEHHYKKTIDKGHGRIEEREYITCPIEKLSLENRCQWSGIKSIVCTTTVRTEISTGKVSQETRFFITSHHFEDIETIARTIRSHWSIENSLHYVLDVTFDEDKSRIRANNAAEVFNRARKLALNILKCDKSKGSIRTKRLRAAWDNSFMEQLLRNFKGRMN